jgi:HAD superfamily hydrolase (TIGR01549 family)
MNNNSKFDCALFDIDGVLVDIRKSYNEAIKKTVEFVLEKATGNKKFRGLVTDQLILRFRQSGGFNNDTDTSYAIALAILASNNPSMVAEKKGGMAQARRFLFQVAQNADETGIIAVEKFLSKNSYDISRYKEMLAYPAPVRDSYIGRVFDELFYGPELFRKQNGLAPVHCSPKRPLIANDRLAVSARTLKTLHAKLGGNLAIVSGRSRLAAEYSLSPVMQYFNMDACVFLEDEPREHAKPNPYAVKKAMSEMKASTAIYAGDSTEDMLMARRAEKEAGYRIAFVGIYGMSPEAARSAKKFKEQGAEAVARSVNGLPAAMKKLLSR